MPELVASQNDSTSPSVGLFTGSLGLLMNEDSYGRPDHLRQKDRFSGKE